jgi:hypothetical protein
MILLALNELNLQYIKGYIKLGKLNNFSKLLDNGVVSTTSEDKYELFEPWIQWVTVQTGLSYDEHKIFRLGDIVSRKDLKQIFEILEESNLTVGAISPFNADNRLNNSKFFIPDPWTQSKTSGNFLIKKVSLAISRIVNNNASGRFGIMDIVYLLIGVLYFARFKSYPDIFKLAINFKKPGVKAAILDFILLELFVVLQKKHKPNYSHLFFNAGAHIQHHYMFNSSQYTGNNKNPEWYCPNDWDPLIMILETYDKIIGDLLKTNERIIALTALQQVPHEEQTFYWRPKEHKSFLKELGIKTNFNVIPRMSRDFLIEFSSVNDALEANLILNNYKDSIYNNNVFRVDNRGESLFVEIIFDKDVDADLFFYNGISEISKLKNKLAFVAIKNGKHDGNGFVFSNRPLTFEPIIQLKDVFSQIRVLAVNDAMISNN